MPRLFAFSFTVFAALAAAPVASAADDDVKTIITQAIKAHGGEEFLSKHKAARSQNKGKITLPGVGEAEFTQDLAYMLPDKLKDSLELNIGGQKITIATLLNGDKLSIEAAGKPIPITDEIKSAMKDGQHMMSVARLTPLLKDKSYELSLFGEAKVEDKPTIGIRVSQKGKKDLTLFFDKKTHLLAKIEHRTQVPGAGQEVNEERIILEYKKDKNGISLPKKVLVKHDGKTFLEADSVETEYLESIDESEFKK
ncbi:MAG TPA: hypothetical protein VN641_11310 [Urbifossiella sp.]|jgi:hypothetical protein|nr:hypothetical protein [Urbifossiella sp.]